MRSHRRPATTLPERNLGTRLKISESDLVLTGSKRRFQIGASRAVTIAGRTNIRLLPNGCDNRCTSTHAPQCNFGPRIEFRETSVLSTVSECRFRIVVTLAFRYSGGKLWPVFFLKG
ncbi:hypothetical protein Taro_031947 [Colocasia esculenta]|uniref:Uncharacterized protein n=1 Tax=Colocasia esculenta TaxID=4460 RepID=A0A843VVZ8_COLES|nr:hypothetical protein [Colocasia esculenta]